MNTLQYDVKRTQQALQFLVDSPYGVRHINRLKALVPKPRALPFKAEAEPLNELLVIGRQNWDAFVKLLDVVQFKRRSRGSYQREFMAAKRLRERNVIQLECLLREKNLSLDERAQVLSEQYQKWTMEKQAYLAAYADAEWLERNAAIREFWANVDQDLERKLRIARDREERNVRRKQEVHVWSHPKSQLGEKLAQAFQAKGALHLDKRL